jgi:hypothetical protein
MKLTILSLRTFWKGWGNNLGGTYFGNGRGLTLTKTKNTNRGTHFGRAHKVGYWSYRSLIIIRGSQGPDLSTPSTTLHNPCLSAMPRLVPPITEILLKFVPTFLSKLFPCSYWNSKKIQRTWKGFFYFLH